jgi:hypothetical protein
MVAAASSCVGGNHTSARTGACKSTGGNLSHTWSQSCIASESRETRINIGLIVLRSSRSQTVPMFLVYALQAGVTGLIPVMSFKTLLLSFPQFRFTDKIAGPYREIRLRPKHLFISTQKALWVDHNGEPPVGSYREFALLFLRSAQAQNQNEPALSIY